MNDFLIPTSRQVICALLLTFCLSAATATGQTREVFEGEASYYSTAMHGHKMSSGERYDKNGYTCAHLTLPFGTMLKVTNLSNGKTTQVRVADRGPHGRGRVIDLSTAAARDLGMLRAGLAHVRCEVMPSEMEIWQEQQSFKMSEEPEYMKQFQLDPPELRQELDWPNDMMPQTRRTESQKKKQEK